MNEDVPAILCHFTKLEECHIKRDYHFKLPYAFKLFQSIKNNKFFFFAKLTYWEITFRLSSAVFLNLIYHFSFDRKLLGNSYWM